MSLRRDLYDKQPVQKSQPREDHHENLAMHQQQPNPHLMHNMVQHHQAASGAAIPDGGHVGQHPNQESILSGQTLDTQMGQPSIGTPFGSIEETMHIQGVFSENFLDKLEHHMPFTNIGQAAAMAQDLDGAGHGVALENVGSTKLLPTNFGTIDRDQGNQQPHR